MFLYIFYLLESSETVAGLDHQQLCSNHKCSFEVFELKKKRTATKDNYKQKKNKTVELMS